MSARSKLTIERIVSGGQTGVDRAALDAALAAGLPIGGWCPAGRRSEDGTIPDEYPLKETDSSHYQVRTEFNVRDSDATLIIVRNAVKGGTRLTQRLAEQQGKALHIVKLKQGQSSVLEDPTMLSNELTTLRDWLAGHNVTILNVAGPRASSDDSLYEDSRRFLLAFLHGQPDAA